MDRPAPLSAVRAQLAERSSAAALSAAWVALLAVPAWSGFDWVLEPEHAVTFLRLRLAADVPGLALLWLLHRPVGRRHPELLVLLLLIVVQGEISWMAAHADHSPELYVLGLSLPLFGSGCLLGGPARWTGGLIAATAALAGGAVLTAPAALPGRELGAQAFYLATAALIGLLAHSQRYRLTVRELNARAHLEQEQARTSELLARLERLSHEDPLTGLANRRRWDAELEAACAQARSCGDGLAVVLLDVDHFKQVNDRYGHAGGDDALRQVAALLTRRVRPADLVARLGGDELAVLLRGADVDRAVELAERLRDEARLLRPLGAPQPALTLSLGVAATAGACAVPRELVAAADAQLYRAKATRDAVSAQRPAAAVPSPRGMLQEQAAARDRS